MSVCVTPPPPPPPPPDACSASSRSRSAWWSPWVQYAEVLGYLLLSCAVGYVPSRFDTFSEAKPRGLPPLNGGELQLCLGSLLECDTGGWVWPGALGLCSWLREDPELVKGASVLDLGCGTGIIGVAMTTMIDAGGINARVWYSDKEDVRRGTLSNIKSNFYKDLAEEEQVLESSSETTRNGEEDLAKLIATMSPVLDTECYYRFATISISKKLKISGPAAISPVGFSSTSISMIFA